MRRFMTWAGACIGAAPLEYALLGVAAGGVLLFLPVIVVDVTLPPLAAARLVGLLDPFALVGIFQMLLGLLTVPAGLVVFAVRFVRRGRTAARGPVPPGAAWPALALYAASAAVTAGALSGTLWLLAIAG